MESAKRTAPLFRLAVVAGMAFVVMASAVVASAGSAGAGLAITGSSQRAFAPGASGPPPPDPSGIQFDAFRSFGLPIVPGAPFYLQVMRGAPLPVVHIVEVVGDTTIDLGTPSWEDSGSVNGVGRWLAYVQVSDVTQGEHHYAANFEATGETEASTVTLTVNVQPVATATLVTTSANPAQANHQVILMPEVTGEGTGFARTGTVEWRDADTDTVLDTRSIASPELTFPSLPIGTRRFVATYSGDATHEGSTSPVFKLVVVGDDVDASGVGLQYATFYPVKDGYRDTVAIRGTRSEPIAVQIRVYSPTGKVVRSASVASGSGAYTYPWNGRTSSGSVLAAGTYRVVQTLTDAFGSKAAYTDYVKVSRKKLVEHTTYVTKRGSSISAKGAGGSASVSVSTTAGYAKLKAGNDRALAGWEFKLPAATIYRSMRFQAQTRTGFGVPSSSIAIQAFNVCPRTTGKWYRNCFDHWQSIGNASGSLAWYSTAGSVTSDRAGRYVRGLVDVPYGTTYVYKVRVRIAYAVLE